MSKNIVVFSDGTGQDGGSLRNTNVYKMFNMAENRTSRQTCFYDPGVGTAGLTRVGGLASGIGFGRNVRSCYRFIHDQYQAGDRIFLIGFSRGAATVRALSYFIHLFGILPPWRDKLIDEAWKIFTIADSERRAKEAEDFILLHHTMRTTVSFIGCFDTVVALGSPYQWASRAIDRLPGMKHRFYDFGLSPCVEHAYHALALDDRRKTFHPVLWDPLETPPAATGNGAPEAHDERTLRQVWFAGMHADVGGGYLQQQLSDIPLVWMTDMAVRHGFLIYPKHRVRILEHADAHMHDSRAKWGRIYRPAPRTWDTRRTDTPIIHESALQRTTSITNAAAPPYLPWLAQHNPEVEPWKPYQRGKWDEEEIRAERGSVPA